MISSGSCSNLIATEAECEAAAEALGLADTSAYVYSSSSSYSPPGCYFTGGSYGLNLRPESSTGSCSSSYQCICELSPPSPPEAPPPPPSSPMPPAYPPGVTSMAGGFFSISSGNCGGAMITDALTCAAAATALGFSDTTVDESTYSYAPPGCAYPSGYLYLYPATNTQSCSTTKNCLCAQNQLHYTSAESEMMMESFVRI